MAFGIEQPKSDGSLKVRRGEDWRRSYANGLADTIDKPVYQDLDHLAAGVAAHVDLMPGQHEIWGHDHRAAYRQLPAGPQWLLFVILFTAQGPSLWKHRVALFGSKGAVWAYLRVGDALVTLARCFLLINCFHFVDDYFGAGPVWESYSAFSAFEEFNNALGFDMKVDKRMSPRAAAELLGVITKVCPKYFSCIPTEFKKNTIVSAAARCLELDEISQNEAARLQGQANFLFYTCFGAVGGACLRPLALRASRGGRPKLTAGLRLALSALVFTPMIRELAYPARPSARCHADAFYI